MPTLAGTFLGNVMGDFGTSAPLRFQFSGTPDATVASTSLGPGAHIDCHGDHGIDPVEFPLSGKQTTANADGSSAWELTGRFEFDASVHVVVDVAVHGVLGADGHSFTGPVDLHVQPDVVSDCTRHWSFSATNITSAVFLYN